MLTLVATPKPFTGHVGRIQRRALASWRAAAPHAEIVIVGTEEGTAAAAAEVGARHVADVERTPAGTPRLDAVLDAASEAGLVCYVNGDILLPPSFLTAVESAFDWRPRFMLTGTCDNVDVVDDDDDEIDFDALRVRASPRGHDFIDWFVFPSGLLDPVPPFAVGRAAFDNWMLRRALDVGAPLIDASAVLRPLHQNHDYAHLPSVDAAYVGEEAERNRRLAAGRYATLLHATHRLTPHGVRRDIAGSFRVRAGFHTLRLRVALAVEGRR